MITINGAVFELVDTSANWLSNNPILGNKQQGFDSTAKAFKIGDGVTAWNSLPFYYANSVVTPIALSFTTGTSLPITISSFDTTYAAYGDYPTILVLNASTGDEITNPTINRSPVTTPDTVTINAADDGTGITDSDLLIIIKL